jgi:hypothetical protein
LARGSEGVVFRHRAEHRGGWRILVGDDLSSVAQVPPLDGPEKRNSFPSRIDAIERVKFLTLINRKKNEHGLNVASHFPPKGFSQRICSVRPTVYCRTATRSGARFRSQVISVWNAQTISSAAF